MDVKDLAVSYHPQGNNCAQCVLKSCKEFTGLDDETAFAIANGFGGGLRSGEICGSISGGVMAIGLAAAKKGITAIAPVAKAYVNEFSEKYGCVRCVELKGKGISCDELIGFGAEMAERYINNL